MMRCSSTETIFCAVAQANSQLQEGREREDGEREGGKREERRREKREGEEREEERRRGGEHHPGT